MRVKTVPRHMNVHTNASNTFENSETITDISMKEEEKEEEKKDIKADVSELNQENILMDTSNDFSIAGPSHCHCHKQDYGVDNIMHLNVEPDKTAAVSSNSHISQDEFCKQMHRSSWQGDNSERFENDISSRWIRDEVNNNDTDEVVDLSTKVCQTYSEDQTLSTEPEDKFKDTFLYKIMTDPTFLDNIQKGKQQRKFSCPFCKEDFFSDEQLTAHMEVKRDESNQVICCACKKTFAQKRYLRYHQRCHSERTKFTCDLCTRKYTRLDNLARHNAFHFNPDKFSCGSCEKTFARKDLLNRHQKCHDNKGFVNLHSWKKY